MRQNCLTVHNNTFPAKSHLNHSQSEHDGYLIYCSITKGGILDQSDLIVGGATQHNITEIGNNHLLQWLKHSVCVCCHKAAISLLKRSTYL